MARFSINRRNVLRGIGGFTLALPPLEIMSGAGRARAAGVVIPKRFCDMWCGLSLTGSDRITYDQQCFPLKKGLDWEVTRGLAPIAGGPKWKTPQEAFSWQSLQKDVGVVSGLRIPIAAAENDPAPPGGQIFCIGVHGGSDACQLAGMTPAGGSGRPSGGAPTVDQRVADALPAGAQRRNIALSVQAHTYGVDNESPGPLSWDRSGSPLDPQPSPVNAFKTVFDVSGLMTTDKATYDKLVKRRKSVIDLVRDNSASMVSRLGGADKQRMQRYYDEVRGLETRIDKFASDPSCQVPAAPAADPPEGGVATTEEFLQAQKDGDIEAPSVKCWSNETLRAELMTEVIAMAFHCNISPVAFLKITNTKSFMYTKSFTGAHNSMHGLTHTYENSAAVADGVAWHVNIFARLAAKLKAMPEIDGSPVLDHTVLALLFEGGCGELNPQELAGFAAARGGRWAHSCDDMMVVYAGGAALGLQHQHIACGNQRHPAEVLLTLMNAIGAPGPLGAMNKIIPEMGITALQ